MSRSFALVLVATACARGTSPAPAAPKSYSQHVADATEAERKAAEQDKAAGDAKQRGPEWVCPGDPAQDVPSPESGGERLIQRKGCYEASAEDRGRHRRAAQRLRAEARRHYEAAQALVDAERTACAPVTEADKTRTPFGNRDDVAAVVRTSDGARITFRRATRAALEKTIACHRARARTMGHDPAYMPYDPTVLAGTSVAIADSPAGAVVTVRGADAAVAAEIWARANALQ